MLLSELKDLNKHLNALTTKKAKNTEISIYFSKNTFIALYHAPP